MLQLHKIPEAKLSAVDAGFSTLYEQKRLSGFQTGVLCLKSMTATAAELIWRQCSTLGSAGTQIGCSGEEDIG